MNADFGDMEKNDDEESDALMPKEMTNNLLLFQLGNLWLCLGDLPVDLGDLLQEVVLGAPHVVPLRRPVVRGRADGLHLGVVAGLLEEKTRFSFSDLNGLENDPSLSEHTVIINPANNTKVMYQYPSGCV